MKYSIAIFLFVIRGTKGLENLKERKKPSDNAFGTNLLQRLEVVFERDSKYDAPLNRPSPSEG